MKYRNNFNKKIKNTIDINQSYDNVNQSSSSMNEQTKEIKQSSNKIKKYKWIAEYINIDRINIDTKVGLDDVFVTSMIIPVVSSILAIGLQKCLPQATKRFSINPVYNKLCFSMKGAIYVTAKLKDIIYIAFRILKERKNVKSA